MKNLLPLLLTFNIGINGYRNEREKLEGFVVGGVDVPILMYPHIAQIFYKDQICGGSIISNRVILTAAHCLYRRADRHINANDIKVRLGSDKLAEGVKYRGCKAITHEKYKSTKEVTFYYYDIGLILLSKDIKFGPTVRKVNIATTEQFRNIKYLFTIAGFGVISNLYPTIPSKKLKATRMYYVKTKECNESQSYRGVMNVPQHMFCMIGHGWTSDCFGDSGSGIIWRRQNLTFIFIKGWKRMPGEQLPVKPLLISKMLHYFPSEASWCLCPGIVSTGRDNYCGSDVIPSMYTDLVYFRKWVAAKVVELESTPAEKC